MREGPPQVVGTERTAAQRRVVEAGFVCQVIKTAPPADSRGRYRLGGEERVIQQRTAGDEIVLVLAPPLGLPGDHGRE